MADAADGDHVAVESLHHDLHHDSVAQQLLHAASEVLASEGAGALTVRRIASDAGMSTMNVYSRFGGKDGIIDHLFIEGFTRLAESQAAVPFTDDPLADLFECGLAYRRFALANPTYYVVMFECPVAGFVPSAAAGEHAFRTLQDLADRVARAMDAGAIARSDPFQLAAALWATSHGAVSLELKTVGPTEVDWEGVHLHATTALLAGLRSGAGQAAEPRPGRRA